MNVTTLGIDLAKNVSVHGEDARGRVVLRKRLSRKKLSAFVAQLPSCLIGMEACGGAHYWARVFRELGHEVRLMPPQYIKPYVKTNKNDYNDAEAICEAVRRPNMRFVGIKEVEQQDVQTLFHDASAQSAISSKCGSYLQKAHVSPTPSLRGSGWGQAPIHFLDSVGRFTVIP